MKHLTLRSILLMALILCLLYTIPAIADNLRAKEYPASAVARMYVKYNCGCERVGNGTMVSRRGLITAGHLLICPYHGQWANDIQFKFLPQLECLLDLYDFLDRNALLVISVPAFMVMPDILRNRRTIVLTEVGYIA